MAAANVLEFVVKLTDKFSGELKKVQGSLTGFHSGLSTSAGVLAGAMSAAGGAIFLMAKSVVEARQEVLNTSIQLGITTEQLSSLRYAANMADVENQQLTMGLKRLSVAAGEASQGNETALKTFEKLGIQLRDNDGSLKDAAALFPEVASRLQKLDSATQRASVAAEIFGVRNLAIMQMMEGGSAKLQEMASEAERFGRILSASSAKSAEDFDQAYKRMGQAITGVKGAFVNNFLPSYTAGMNTLAFTLADNRTKVAEWGSSVLGIFLKVGEGIALAVAGWKDIFTIAGRFIADQIGGYAKTQEEASKNMVAAVWRDIESLSAKRKALLDQLGKSQAGDFFGKDILQKQLDDVNKKITEAQKTLGTYNANRIEWASIAGNNQDYVKAINDAGSASEATKNKIEELRTAMMRADPRNFVGPPEPPGLRGTGEGEGGTELGGGEGKGGKKDNSDFENAQKELVKLYQETTMTEEQLVNEWYKKESALFKGHADEQKMLAVIRDKQLLDIRNKGMDDLVSAYEQATMTESQRRDKKYADDLKAYEGNEDALALITETYNAEKLNAQQKNLEELQSQRDEIVLNDMEKLDLWYAEELLKYEEHSNEMLLVQEIYQARRQQLLEDGYKTFEEENETFLSSLQSQFNDWQMSQAEMNNQMTGLLLDSFEMFSQGLGDAVARAVVYGEDMGDMMNALLKQIAANIISTFVTMLAQMAIQSILANVLNTQSKTSLMSTSVAAAAATTYAEVFATYASIPYVGPALGAAAGAAAAASLIAGSGVSFATGKAAGMAMGQGGGAIARRKGGPVEPNNIYLVGEAGPELLMMGEGMGGNIIPNNEFTPVGAMSDFQTINREGSTFVQQTGGDTRIDNLEIRVLDNATNHEGLMRMDVKDWEDIVYTRILPAFQKLKGAGIQI